MSEKRSAGSEEPDSKRLRLEAEDDVEDQFLEDVNGEEKELDFEDSTREGQGGNTTQVNVGEGADPSASSVDSSTGEKLDSFAFGDEWNFEDLLRLPQGETVETEQVNVGEGADSSFSSGFKVENGVIPSPISSLSSPSSAAVSALTSSRQSASATSTRWTDPEVNTQSSTLWRNFCIAAPSNIKRIAPVSYFKNAPMADEWDSIANVGLAVEVINPFAPCRNPPQYMHWIAKVVAYAGYKALVRFEKAPQEKYGDGPDEAVMWVNFCSSHIRYLGYGGENGIPLRPVIESLPVVSHEFIKSIFDRLREQGTKTLAKYHYEISFAKISKAHSKFKYGDVVEGLNRDDISKYKLGRIVAVKGDRVLVRYCGEENTDPGFWYSQNSPHLHRYGWCNAVGAKLVVGKKARLPFYRPTPTIPVSQLPKKPKGQRIKSGMIFEMVHPYFTDKIVVGYVAKKTPFTHGYFLAATDWTRKEELVEITMHVTSDYILPLHFCKENNVELQPPADYKKRVKKVSEFSWGPYLDATRFVPLNLVKVQRPHNRFEVGHKLEAIHTRSPDKMQPATVIQKAGHLIMIRFDGSKKTQWVSCASPDIYPAGYAEMIRYELSGTVDENVIGGNEKEGVKGEASTAIVPFVPK